ncbi:MAG: CoA pyrophosphatase [Flavobacteriales bacterium]|nr:CoA pyrophosphatase [Flavobacteriales bacterium]
MLLSPSELRAALEAPLPGHNAFMALSGYPRASIEAVLALSPPPRESAVLILIHPVNGTDHTLLMRRAIYPGVHSGQIAFPGGKREAEDPSLIDTAIREFQEETGANTSGFEIMGQLTRIHIPPSHTLVTPVVAWAPQLGSLRPDPREVDELLDVPLPELLRDDILFRKPIRMNVDGSDHMVVYWDVLGETVWGATALMIAELRTILGHPIRPTW